jgi:ubiquinone biosynthesis protein
MAQAEQQEQPNADLLKQLIAEQRRTNTMLAIAIYFGGGLVGGILVVQLIMRWYGFVW